MVHHGLPSLWFCSSVARDNGYPAPQLLWYIFTTGMHEMVPQKKHVRAPAFIRQQCFPPSGRHVKVQVRSGGGQEIHHPNIPCHSAGDVGCQTRLQDGKRRQMRHSYMATRKWW
jgi:hypothetical protein